ncbi:MAG: hypothetical protein JXB32_26265 [Deltaproteobacteria bacterium]|nr:hypothetical protein [Deltaproteobacteria bacterium]
MERGRHRRQERLAGLGARLTTLGLVLGCSACPTTPSSDDGGDAEACTFASCEEACRARGLCYGSCAGGRCNCSTNCGGDVDARPDTPYDRWEDTDGADLDAADRFENDDGEIEECPQLVPDEVRAGASPGITCRRMSVAEAEHGLYEFSGDGDRIVYSGDDPTAGHGLWEVRRASRCTRLVAAGRAPTGGSAFLTDPAVERDRVAYSFTFPDTESTERCELQLLDLETGVRRTLDANTSANREPDNSPGCFIDYVSLEYPWVVWRDTRENPPYVTRVYAYDLHVFAVHIETGEFLPLTVDPVSGEITGGSLHCDLSHGWAVFDQAWWDPDAPPDGNTIYEIVAFDLATRTRIQITDAPFDQYRSTASADWIAWTDLRNAGGWTWFQPCHADIHGYDRRTGEEVPLVWEGTAAHGPEVNAMGPWLAYGDYRWSSNPDCPDQRHEDIVALHMPTRTEIRVTDWPGHERNPQLYDRGDGTYGLLLAEEMPGEIYLRLWDCDLPEP